MFKNKVVYNLHRGLILFLTIAILIAIGSHAVVYAKSHVQQRQTITNLEQGDYVTGREILKKAVAAAGGIETFKKIDNFTIKTQNEITGAQTKTKLTVTETMQLPNKTKQIMQLPIGTRIQVLNGDNSWKKLNSTVSDLTQAEKREMQRGLFRDIINLFKRFDDDDYLEVKYFSDETLGGETHYVLQIKNSTGDFFNLYINSKTYLVQKKTYHGATEVGLATLEEIYSDYKEVDGIKIPHRTVVKANGKQFIDSIVVDAKINSKLAEGFFFED